MKNTTEIGDISVAMITAALLKSRVTVLKPISDGLRYDLVIYSGQFWRDQCKTGLLKKQTIIFRCCSVERGNRTRHYRGDAELFGVYCPATEKSYLVPVEKVGVQTGRLRLVVDGISGPKPTTEIASNYEINAGIAQWLSVTLPT